MLLKKKTLVFCLAFEFVHFSLHFHRVENKGLRCTKFHYNLAKGNPLKGKIILLLSLEYLYCSASIPDSHYKQFTAYSLELQPTFITRRGENPLKRRAQLRLEYIKNASQQLQKSLRICLGDILAMLWLKAFQEWESGYFCLDFSSVVIVGDFLWHTKEPKKVPSTLLFHSPTRHKICIG